MSRVHGYLFHALFQTQSRIKYQCELASAHYTGGFYDDENLPQQIVTLYRSVVQYGAFA